MFNVFWRTLRNQLRRSRPAKKDKTLRDVWRIRPVVLQLEDRVVPAALLVTNANDVYTPLNSPAPFPINNLSLRNALELVHGSSNGGTWEVDLVENTYQIQLPQTGQTDPFGNPIDGEFQIAPPAGTTSVLIKGGFLSNGTADPAATPASTVINAQGLDRVFEIVAPSGGALTVTFQNLTIENGAPAGSGGNGGGILEGDGSFSPNQNALVLNDVVVSGNKSPSSSPISGGGGIWTANASVTLENGSVVTGNQTQGDGGGIGTVSGNVSVLSGSSVTFNTAHLAGGGIYYAGADSSNGNPAGVITVSGTANTVSSVSNNTSGPSSTGQGGGIYANNPTGTVQLEGGGGATPGVTLNNNLSGAEGGAIYTTAAHITVDSSQLDFNQSSAEGGALAIASSSSSNGPNNLSVTGSDLSGNKAGGDGGAIYNVSVGTVFIGPNAAGTNSTFNNNYSGGFDGGGAIYDNIASTLTITGASATSPATFKNNDAANGSGGALYAGASNVGVTITDVLFQSNDAGSEGGAVYVPSGNTFSMTGSTVTGNTASSSGGGVLANSTVVTIQSSTFTGNSSTSNSGGAISNVNTASLAELAVSSTVFGSNQAGSTGGGIDSGTTEVVLNSVIVGATINGTGGLISAPNRSASDGGGVNYTGTGTLAVATSVVANNTSASNGGGINTTSASQVGITGTTVQQNTATQNGGGVNVAGSISGSELLLANATVTANVTSGTGGGINTTAAATNVNTSDIIQNQAATGGGGIAYTTSGPSSGSAPSLTVNMSSIIQNQAGGQGSGGGILAAATKASGSSAPTPVVNVVNTTVGANTAGSSGGGLSNTQGDLASILYSTFAYNQAGTGGGIASNFAGASSSPSTAPTPNTNLGDTIVSQNFNFAPGPGAGGSAVSYSDSYPGEPGNPDAVPPYPSPTVSGPDLAGAFGNLTQGGLATTLSAGYPSPGDISPSLAQSITGNPSQASIQIAHNAIGDGDGQTTGAAITNNPIFGNQVGTSSASILFVGPITANGVPTFATTNPILVGPNLPSGLSQYMATPLPANGTTTATAQQGGFADQFIFTVAPTDQVGSPLTNTSVTPNTQVVFLRPITDANTTPPSNNPDIGAMEVTQYPASVPTTSY